MAGAADDSPLTDRARFFYGLFGASAPEILRWSKIALRPTESDLPANWLIYLVVLTGFIAAGGIFATLWRDDNRVKCFYFGATFPAFVSAIIAAPPALPR